jgi:murein tripeptide amidase MpaA
VTADLPQLIADEIKACLGDDSELRDPEEVISTVTQSLMKRVGMWTQANKSWALRVCVRGVYVSLRTGARPRAKDIEGQKKIAGVQRTLPGWVQLLKWRIKFDDGLEIAAAFATLAQIEFAAGKYAKLSRENATKGQHLAALADAMREAGYQADQTVESFYQSVAA